MSGHGVPWAFRALFSDGTWVLIVCPSRREAQATRRRFRREGQTCGKIERKEQ